jgi:hypothetical protein
MGVDVLDSNITSHDEDSDFILVEAIKEELVVDNGLIRVTVDASGRISHLYDIANK